MFSPLKRPGNQPLKQTVSRKMPLHKAVANRPDGLGARLCAVFNALLVSEITGCDFALVWPETYVNSDRFHAVPPVEKIFSAEFVAAHCLPPDSPEAARARPIPLPGRMLPEDARKYFRESMQQSDVCLPWNQLLRRLRITPQERDALVNNVIRRMQFTAELRHVQHLSMEVLLPKLPAAIHLRSGDIVYGRFAENPNFAGKTIPTPLAKLIIEEDRTGAGFVLMGQEPEFAAKLAAAGKALDAAHYLPELSASAVASAFRDIFLMARCDSYCAGSSGFAAFAENIGKCKVAPWERIRTKAEWARMILEEVKKGLNSLYTERQAGFACFFAYDCLCKSEDVASRTLALAMAREFSPENRLYGLLSALNAFDDGLWEKGESALAELATRLDLSLDALLASREMRRICSSRSGSGTNPYERHVEGIHLAAQHGCRTAEILLPLICEDGRS
jgi:hypothetical protein